MRLDPVVAKRFGELDAKAEGLASMRVHDFTSRDNGVSYYTIPSAAFKQWATSVQNLLARTFGEESVHYRNFTKHADAFGQWESEFEDCRGIFLAAKEDYEGGYLFDVSSLAKAEVLADALAQARELLRAGYKDPACVLARVALEVTLKQAAAKQAVAHGKLDRMNADLCKAGVYNMARQKQITAWADIGNKAAHGDWTEYDENDARAMVDGVEAIVADIL
jgi:hypothetical protein